MAAESQLDPTQPINQQTYRILHRDIVHYLIPPDTPLSEKEVSIRLDVSRQPVREASIKLTEDGLIQIRPQRGSYVNRTSLSQVRNGCFAHRAIKYAVVRRTTGMINDEQVYQLEQGLHQQRIAVDKQQSSDFFLLDDEFHQELSIIAGCQLTWDTMENIEAAIDRVRYISLDHIISPKILLHQHYEIFIVLEERDAEAVEQTMNVHLYKISKSVLLICQEDRNWFSED